MMATLRFALLPGLLLFIACGGSTLTEPEELPIRTYAAGVEFRLTVVMATCSDSCAKYEPAECSVDVDGDHIRLDASVCFERVMDDCSEQCGAPVVAHCTVPALSAGTYIVESGDFQETITVR